MEEKKEKILNMFLEEKILLSPNTFSQMLKTPEMLDNDKDLDPNILVLLQETRTIPQIKTKQIDWLKLDQLKVLFEKENNKEPYLNFLNSLNPTILTKSSQIQIITSYEEESKKRDIQDFISYFNARYKAIERILRQRQELQSIMSINRIQNKKDKEEISLIGLVKDKNTTSNGNLLIGIEDPTGCIKILVNKNKPELFARAKNIVLDEVIGVVGANGDNIIFVNNILWPDVPLTKELKKSPEEGYAVFLSDLHVGSNNFLSEEFKQFLQWINQQVGNEKQKELASKVKYIIIVGDLIDGIGIYPEQDTELLIKDAKGQYEECANLLKQIPPHINLIICPGNHDAMRIAEPQPVFYRDFAEAIWNLPNITMVSNPSMVNIHGSKDFPGFDILLYHGYSFDYYVSNVDSIRNNGGYDRGDLIMKFLLQRRHLAPSHSSTLYIPQADKDPLVIDKIPDFFVTGHIHKSTVANYKNITMICGSCWQAKTPFQEKVGHNPEPARVPIVNLQTREIKILNFSK